MRALVRQPALKKLGISSSGKMDASGEWNGQARYAQHVDRAIYLIFAVRRCRLGPSSAQLIRRSFQLVCMAIALRLHADTYFDSHKCASKWDRKAKIFCSSLSCLLPRRKPWLDELCYARGAHLASRALRALSRDRKLVCQFEPRGSR